MSGWNWHVPGVTVRVPNTQQPIPADPTPWDALTFGPLCIFELRRDLGARTDEAGRFMASRPKFEAADAAWLATGACNDGQHEVEHNRFFPEFDSLRNETPIGSAGSAERRIFMELVKKTIFDLATKADRAIDSTTLILHVEGTTMPGAPLAPEFLKAHVYMPPSFIRENPGAHAAITTIAQLFIEHISVPTAAAWERRAHVRGWSLTQGNGTIPAAPLTTHLPMIPTPAPRSAYYIFCGRPTGYAPITRGVPRHPVDLDDLERISDLETKLTSLSGHLWNMEEQVSILHGVVADYEARDSVSKAQIVELEAEITHLQQEARASRSLFSSPSSSASRSRAPMTPSRPPPYLASFALSPATLTPSSSGRSAGTLHGAPAAATLGDSTHQFLQNEGLMAHYDMLRFICGLFSPLKWAAEIDRLNGFPAEAKEGLLTALEEDGTYFLTGRQDFRKHGAQTLRYLNLSLPALFANPRRTPKMLSSTKTIAAVSNTRVRQPLKTARAPLTTEERKQKRETTEKTQGEMDDAVREWVTDTHKKAEELALRFDKKARYFLDIFYQGGAHMVNHHKKINAYNAFKSEKAAECRENGEALNVPALHKEYHEEYARLTEEEKAVLVQRFEEQRSEPKICHLTPRARIQEVANTVRNMQMLLTGLSERVGIEGFFIIARSNTDFNMSPQCYFTSQALECYMPFVVRKRWDTAETFCDLPPSEWRTQSARSATTLEGDLVEVSGNLNAAMAYVNYEANIVLKHGVELVGWTADKFCSPSELTSSLPILRKLLNALESGDCMFVKLGPAELKQRKLKLWESKANAVRNDETTWAALARIKNGVAPGSAAGRAFKSRPIISDDKEDAEDPPAAPGPSRPVLSPTGANANGAPFTAAPIPSNVSPTTAPSAAAVAPSTAAPTVTA
ncbi:hypothetical protein DFH09DRAFT_1073634 [Mycena vulgaris]|nr:hypothetical protein DFH09DRAFT_1073634 [Mycena vulgaris]